MICEICEKNQATTIGEVESQTKYLCSSCYKKFINSGEFSDIIGQVEKELCINKFCNNCGMSLQDVKSSGMFGCNNCYETFYDLLNAGNNITNMSTVPKLFEIKEKIANYNDLIERALHRQDYETARQLSQKINSIRSEYVTKL